MRKEAKFSMDHFTDNCICGKLHSSCNNACLIIVHLCESEAVPIGVDR